MLPYCPNCGALLTTDRWHVVRGIVICVACLDALEPRLIETLRHAASNATPHLMTKARGLTWYTPITDADPPHFTPPPHAQPLTDIMDAHIYVDANGHPLLP